MQNRRATDKRLRDRIREEFLRLWFLLTVMTIMFIASLFLPRTKEEAEAAGSLLNIMALFVTKTNSVLWGWSIAHLGRLIMFPYMDLQKYIEDKNWPGVAFLAILYGIVIHAFAVGG